MRALVWLGMALLAVVVAPGCHRDRGDKPVVVPGETYLDAPDQTLPAGVVGEPYSASTHVSGGDAPYTWVIADGTGLPRGLSLAPDGTIDGIPAEAGDFSFALFVTDASSRAKRVVVSLQVVLEPNVVRCGETLSGHFDDSAFNVDGPDLTKLDSLSWLGVELPEDLTTRIELVFTSTGVSTLYVERANEVIGSSDLADDYVPFYLNPGFTSMTVALDAGTVPSLTPYLPQPLIPMVLVAQSPADWSVEVVCTDGPIFVDLPQFPTELGQEMDIDYQVYGDNTGVRIYTEDPLPDWMIWDESTGTVTGTASEVGGWEFTIVAETADGRRREERSILGVYAVEQVACGETVPLDVQEGYFDGEFYAYYDPKGYGVFRVALDETAGAPSEVKLQVAGSDGHYLGLAAPDPEILKFYGGAERVYLSAPSLEIPVNPSTYPAIDHYTDATELYFSAGTIGVDLTMDVTVTCDYGPRPDLAALPVFPGLGEGRFTLEGVGGSPPYTWSATGLPQGIVLDRDGTLHGQAAQGEYAVQLTIDDKLGATWTEPHTLYVGQSSACAGYTEITCGDSIDGAFTAAYYNDGNGPASTEVFCLVNTDDVGLGFEVYSDDGELRVDIADPGATASEMFDLGHGTFVSWVDRDSSEGVSVDPFSWPNLGDFEDLPILTAVRAYDPGSWTIHLVCQ